MATMVQTAGGVFAGYDPNGHWCEMFEAPGRPRPHVAELVARLEALGLEELQARERDAESELFNLGITFLVLKDERSVDRILPFDVLPRVISAAEWQRLEAGLVQRVAALNLFLSDVYGAQKAIRDGVVPAELVLKHPQYRPEMQGFRPPHGTWVHIAGIDVVRGSDGVFRVLEDNARVPSGVSYVVENRHLMLRLFADVMEDMPVAPVSDYGPRLYEKLCEVAPEGVDDPQVVVLTPGVYNPAYFEHLFLAREMGVQLVEGRDLFVDEDDRVFVKTVAGPEPVHVIYRRISDAFLDPLAFEPTSLIGVPGLFRAYRRGRVQLANAVGTGVADDKAVYAYMPRLIRYFLGEDPIIPNVETWLCREPDQLAYVLDHLHGLVVKPVGEAGGYGIVVGPQASSAELGELRARILADPANWIAQPVVDLSVAPTLVEGGIEPRHVDLRPFVVTGRESWVLPGGLTRVALRRGSLIVNSSQGGGSKDTWVLTEDPA